MTDTHDTPEAALADALDAAGLIESPEVRGYYATAILAAMPGWALVPNDVVADAERWREAEAEGHIVTFSPTGYGLQHPPSCRPDLTGCRYNRFLASKAKPDRRPGRYRMTLDNFHGPMVAKYARAALAPSEP